MSRISRSSMATSSSRDARRRARKRCGGGWRTVEIAPAPELEGQRKPEYLAHVGRAGEMTVEALARDGRIDQPALAERAAREHVGCELTKRTAEPRRQRHTEALLRLCEHVGRKPARRDFSQKML